MDEIDDQAGFLSALMSVSPLLRKIITERSSLCSDIPFTSYRFLIFDVSEGGDDITEIFAPVV